MCSVPTAQSLVRRSRPNRPMCSNDHSPLPRALAAPLALTRLAQGQDQTQHIVTGRYSDAALKNYALIPVTTVVVTMMVVGVIGIVMTVVIVAIVTMVVTMMMVTVVAIEIGVFRCRWIS